MKHFTVNTKDHFEEQFREVTVDFRVGVTTGCPRKKFLLGFAFKHNENDTKEFHLGHFSTALSV